MWVLRLVLLAANASVLVLFLYEFSQRGLPTPRWVPLGMMRTLILNLIYLWFSFPAAKGGKLGRW